MAIKIRKKGHAGLVFDGSTGQLIQPETPDAPPEDIPSIVERYVGLVGKVLGSLEARGREKGFDNRDVNAVAALGRSVAMLQAVEEARIATVGGRRVKDLTTQELRKRLLEAQPTEETGGEV